MKYLGSKTLETERLILRKVTLEDAERSYENWSNHDYKYVLWHKHDSVEVTKKLYSKWLEEYNDEKTFRWIIELKENHDLVGTIDIVKTFIAYGSCEVGYCLSDKYWHRGYATEALKAVMQYLFMECDAAIINAGFMEDNPASGRVMARAGMNYECKRRSLVLDKEGKRQDIIYYSLTKEEYLNLAKK